MSTEIEREARHFLNTFTRTKDRVQLDELNVKIWKSDSSFSKDLHVANLARPNNPTIGMPCTHCFQNLHTNIDL